jgi:hypothetical protein
MFWASTRMAASMFYATRGLEGRAIEPRDTAEECSKVRS